MEPQKPQRGRGKSRAVCESDLLGALEDMKRLGQQKGSDDATISRIKSAQTRANLIADMLSEKKRDKIGRLQEQLDKKDAEVAALTAKLAAVPPDAAARIKELELANETLRNQPPVVKTVTVESPALVAERDALKAAVGYLAKEGRTDDQKIQLVIEVYDENRAAAKVLAEAFHNGKFQLRWGDFTSLLAKNSTDLLEFQNAYRSPLAPLALSIRARRMKAQAKKEFEENTKMGRELSGPEPVIFPPSPAEIEAREHVMKAYSPEALAARERARQAAENAKLPPPPTTEVAFDKNVEALQKEVEEMLARFRAGEKGDTATSE